MINDEISVTSYVILHPFSVTNFRTFLDPLPPLERDVGYTVGYASFE